MDSLCPEAQSYIQDDNNKSNDNRGDMGFNIFD